MPTYFGTCDSSGNPSGSDGNGDAQITFWATFACPGSGSQDIVEAGADMFGDPSTGNIRIAVYDSAGTTLIAQTGIINVPTNGSVDQWCSDTGITGTLTGGTNYIIAWTVNDHGIGSNHYAGSLGTGNLDGTFYVTAPGFPATLPTPDGTGTGMYSVRVGVNAAAGGGQPTSKRHGGVPFAALPGRGNVWAPYRRLLWPGHRILRPA